MAAPPVVRLLQRDPHLLGVIVYLWGLAVSGRLGVQLLGLVEGRLDHLLEALDPSAPSCGKGRIVALHFAGLLFYI